MASSRSERDRIADERDRIADERERMADKRDQEADERDRQAGVRESSGAATAAPTGDSGATVEGLFGIDLGHRGDRADETELDGDEPPSVRASTKTLTERLANAAADRGRVPLPPSDEDLDEDLDSED